MEFLYEYGLFLTKAITFVVAVGAIIVVIASSAMKQGGKAGELEITDLNKIYLEKEKLSVEIMNRGYAWLDTGTHESLLEAAQFVETIEKRQGYKIACLEEVGFNNGWLTKHKMEELAAPMLKNSYGKYLMDLISK